MLFSIVDELSIGELGNETDADFGSFSFSAVEAVMFYEITKIN
jgi:hypothetical protein